jgi:hypothetical protein
MTSRPFIQKKPSHQFILNGWRYRAAIKISTQCRFYFGPRTGGGRLIILTETDATLNFDAIIKESLAYMARHNNHANTRSTPVNRVGAYEKVLADAEYELTRVRDRLNETVARWRANRRVARWGNPVNVVRRPELIAAE